MKKVKTIVDSEKLMEYLLNSKQRAPEQEYERDRLQERNDMTVLQERCDKKALINRHKSLIEKMQAQIKELESNTQINTETKNKKVARCKEIIQDCQWTLDREIAYMQQRAGVQR